MLTQAITPSSSTEMAGPSTDEIILSGERSESSFSSFSLSDITQAFPFSSGNPRIEETRGVTHLYREDPTSSSPSGLPVVRKPLVCVIGVPNHMTNADFCQFCGSFILHILEMRIVRNEGMEDQYSVLIRFDDQDSTDGFYTHYNGRRFSSLEVEVCRVLFALDVQYTGPIENAQASNASSTEQPTCPVCLERLDQDRYKWNSYNHLQSFFPLFLYFKMGRFFLSCMPVLSAAG
ncbi:hypothetical protein K1719_021486 [Acacia pycnantha]|nr:hypothetical protein K1719_021486 [Acacia pycnantha]